MQFEMTFGMLLCKVQRGDQKEGNVENMKEWFGVLFSSSSFSLELFQRIVGSTMIQ